jgi:hypothetical protein
MLSRQARAIFLKRFYEFKKSLVFFVLNTAFVLGLVVVLAVVAPLISSPPPAVNSNPDQGRLDYVLHPKTLSLDDIFPQYYSVALVRGDNGTFSLPKFQHAHVTEYASLSRIPSNSDSDPSPVNVAFENSEGGSVRIFTPNSPPAVLSLGFSSVADSEVQLAAAAMLVPTTSARRLQVSSFPWIVYSPNSQLNLFATVAPIFVGLASSIFCACLALLSSRDTGASVG